MIAAAGRKEKRKALKKLKRKQCRQQLAESERLHEEGRLQDPQEQLKIQQEAELEVQREELERKEHEEQERLWLERELKAKEDYERKQQEESLLKQNEPHEEDEDGDYEDGPAEVIWVGNEITIRKPRVKVGSEAKEAKDRPTCNPPPPRSIFPAQSNANGELVPEGPELNPNYGTEQDKRFCPFHIKTGACKFGTRCNRAHVYPEKSCTLLIKNMYTGPGLAWEHDEGLEYTDEEVAEQFEEFYEDVHSEFLKFGELVNFKVCRNSSPHLRGNVYVHFKSEESAIAACLALSGRYYASKQMIPEFVGVTKWKTAICGEYMKGTCSRGTDCNFLHCFRNPGGEYDWADHEEPPPRSWKQKMASLFGYQESHEHHRKADREGGHEHRRRTDRDPKNHHSEKDREDHHRDARNYHSKKDREDHHRDARNHHSEKDREDHHSRPKETARHARSATPARTKHSDAEEHAARHASGRSRRSKSNSDEEEQTTRHAKSTRPARSKHLESKSDEEEHNDRFRHRRRSMERRRESSRRRQWDMEDETGTEKHKRQRRRRSRSRDGASNDRWQGGD